jgi:hypothetical protein
MDTATKTEGHALPWNKGKLLGQKPPRVRLGGCAHPADDDATLGRVPWTPRGDSA